MSPVLAGADIRGFYAELGIDLPHWAQTEAPARCFAAPGSHQHADRDPSVSVNLISGAWRCHGCGAKGGAYDAALAVGHNPRSAIDTMIRHGLITRRARLRTAREILNTPKARRPPAARSPRRQGGRRAFDVTETTIQRWQHQLLNNPVLLAELQRERCWGPETIRELQLGLDRRRITIPIRDSNGHLQGVLRYQQPPRDTPKMYALAGSRLGLIPHPAAETSTSILLVEGPPDMIAARSHDLPAIAIPGTESWQPRWAKLLADRHVTIVMDADHAGRRAAAKIAHDLTPVADTRILDLAPSRDDGYDLTDWLIEHQRLQPQNLTALLRMGNRHDGSNPDPRRSTVNR